MSRLKIWRWGSLLPCLITYAIAYDVKNHPCCQEGMENLTLAMIIDAFEIYGHDPTDKLDNLAHYQIEMMKIKDAPNQYIINENVHVATDHLSRFINLHLKELKVLLIALDDTIDNMLTMYENHNAIKAERVATFNAPSGGAVPLEFYLSQEFYCGRNVYIFLSEVYSDIYNMGRGPSPYCSARGFHFLGFVHFMNENKYYLEQDPSVAFAMDNYIHGLECHLSVCVYRFPFKKLLQHVSDVSTLPKAIVKCGTDVYKLPPLTAASCIITSGSFILDFNIQGIRFRHHDYLLFLPNGNSFYTNEPFTPLVCDHHVCEWNNTNYYGGPFNVPGDPDDFPGIVPPFIDQTSTTPSNNVDDRTPAPFDPDNSTTYFMDGCWFLTPPQYGSIAGISYLDPLLTNEWRYSCSGGAGNKGLYWYPQWMGAPPHHPRAQSGDSPMDRAKTISNVYHPHQMNPALHVPKIKPVH